MPAAYWDHKTKQMVKRCSNANCQNPDGPVLPATTDYFNHNKTRADSLGHQCRVCRQQYRKNNSDYNKQYYKDNRKRIQRKDAEYRKWNREKLLEKNRLYYARNRTRILQQKSSIKDGHANERHNIYPECQDISEEEIVAAGDFYLQYARLPGGWLCKVMGRRGDNWIVRLFKPIKVGKKEYEHSLLVRDIHLIEDATSINDLIEELECLISGYGLQAVEIAFRNVRNSIYSVESESIKSQDVD